MLYEAIASVLTENRKVLKVGGQQASSAAPAPDMNAMPPMQDPNMSVPPMDPNAAQAPMGDPNAQMPPMDGGEENQFDTNFDAGVEADEETDPKHYIQQLTGKLSQSLNSFNEENGPDAGLCKYVASMIIAAAAKNLDEKAKKELIEKINTAESAEEEPEEEPVDDANSDGAGNDEAGIPQSQPLQERILTRGELAELAFGITTKERKPSTPEIKKGKKSIFSGKSF